MDNRYLPGRLEKSDLDDIRKRISVGDILYYPRMKKLAGELIQVVEPMEVIAKYKSLVQVESLGEGGKRTTITYAEMLMDPRILDKKVRHKK